MGREKGTAQGPSPHPACLPPAADSEPPFLAQASPGDSGSKAPGGHRGSLPGSSESWSCRRFHKVVRPRGGWEVLPRGRLAHRPSEHRGLTRRPAPAPRPLLPAWDLLQSVFWGGAGTPAAPPSTSVLSVTPKSKTGQGSREDGGGSERTGWLLATKGTDPGWGDGRRCRGAPRPAVQSPRPAAPGRGSPACQGSWAAGKVRPGPCGHAAGRAPRGRQRTAGPARTAESGLWPQDRAQAARGPLCPVGLTAAGGAVLGRPQAPPHCLCRSRLQPSRLLLRLLHRLKTATVPELTPGDPESFLPHPLLTGSLCSQRLLSSGAAAPGSLPPAPLLFGSLRSWRQVKPTAAWSSPPLLWWRQGPLQGGPRQAGPSSLCPLLSQLPLRGLQAEKWGEGGVEGERREPVCPPSAPRPGISRVPKERPPPWFPWFLQWGLHSRVTPPGPHTCPADRKASPPQVVHAARQDPGPAQCPGLCPEPTQEGSGWGMTEQSPLSPARPPPCPRDRTDHRADHPGCFEAAGARLGCCTPHPSGCVGAGE